jgi:hypothetical protein
VLPQISDMSEAAARGGREDQDTQESEHSRGCFLT